MSTTTPRLELVWPNKDKFLLSPTADNGKPVWVDPTHPAASEVRLADFTGTYGTVNDDNPYADNLLFTGDSVDVLRILAEHPEYAREYRGKVKLCYIDPPFNTGQTFAQYDDWMEHSTWLSFMRDRLVLIRELLSTDGSIWVHLDDCEVHRMRCLLDEVFGAANFAQTVVWERTDSAKGNAYMSGAQDYILIYARDLTTWKKVANKLPRDASSDRFYQNPDGDPRGPWKQNADSTVPASKNNVFAVFAPDGREVWPPEGKGWRFTPEKFELARRERRVYFKPSTGRPGIKTYLMDQEGTTARTWWPGAEVGTNRSAKRDHLNKLFGGTSFATPKPEPLIQRVLHIGTDRGDLVLDVFAGSGATAAVAHKMGRRWVTAEISPETVATYVRPRLEMVVDGEPGGISGSVGWDGGGGLRSVKVADSMYEVTDFGVLLAEWATSGRFSRAVAGQLGFVFEADAAPLCGRRGRMRLAVLDGAVGVEEVRHVVAALGEGERVVIVGQAVLPGAEELLAELSRGSRVRVAPDDLVSASAKRARKRAEAAAAALLTEAEASEAVAA